MDDSELPSIVAKLSSGSVVAPAGHGKTQQVVMTAEIAGGRRLVLTHTHAGIDAIKKRFKDLGYSSDKHEIETIAGWALRYATAFPKHSGIKHREPTDENEWSDVYESACRLVVGGAATSVLKASYAGAFVDEYQDCSKLQHDLIKALKQRMSVVVYGDPMQAIFDFKRQQPVEWAADVDPIFQFVDSLKVPWRWRNTGATDLADWIALARAQLESGAPVDLARAPACVTWVELPKDKQVAQATITGTCKTVLGAVGATGEASIVVIADPRNANARSLIARNLSSCGFSVIEPMANGDLNKYAALFCTEGEQKLLEAVVDFIATCMSGAEKTPYLRAVDSAKKGRKAGLAKFGELVGLGLQVIELQTLNATLDLLTRFQTKTGVRLYRRELYYSMKSALRLVVAEHSQSLEDAVYLVQTKIRHTGRILPRRAIGSILLVKGLEFDHSVIIESNAMSAKDWYVALTRASRTITIASASSTIRI